MKEEGVLRSNTNSNDFQSQSNRIINPQLTDRPTDESTLGRDITEDREIRIESGGVVDAERETNRRTRIFGNVDVGERTAAKGDVRSGGVKGVGGDGIKVGAKDWCTAQRSINDLRRWEGRTIRIDDADVELEIEDETIPDEGDFAAGTGWLDAVKSDARRSDPNCSIRQSPPCTLIVR